MRTIKELYILLLDYYIENGNYICNTIKTLQRSGLITVNERVLLFKHFYSQYPTKDLHSEFYINNGHVQREFQIDNAWFPFDNQSSGREIRIDFINKIISTL